jgi:hypothetical protein
MVVNFRAHGISRGASKFARTPTFNKKKKKTSFYWYIWISLFHMDVSSGSREVSTSIRSDDLEINRRLFSCISRICADY